MSEDKNPPVPEEEIKEDFDTRLRHARGLGGEPNQSGAALPEDGKGKAMRIGTELVSAVAVGGGIGFVIDTWLETKPWFLVGWFVEYLPDFQQPGLYSWIWSWQSVREP